MKKLFTFLLFLTFVCAGNSLPLESQTTFFIRLASTSGGGGGASTYSLLAHKNANAANTATATTAPMDTTGAKLIVVVLVNYSTGTRTFTDSKNNTWTLGTLYASGAVGAVQIAYCINPATDPTHTFSFADNYVNISVSAFSYTGTTPTVDGSGTGFADNGSGYTTVQPGSITPAGNNELFITGVAGVNPASATYTVNSSFTITDQSLANTLLGGMAYKIQTTGGAENPTWTSPTSGVFGGTAMLVFK